MIDAPLMPLRLRIACLCFGIAAVIQCVQLVVYAFQ